MKKRFLLIFCTFLCVRDLCLCNEMKDLKFRAVTPSYMEDKNKIYSYEVQFLDTKSKDISYILPKWPQGTKLIGVTLRPTLEGTLMRIDFSIEGEDVLSLPPLCVKIKGETAFIPFEMQAKLKGKTLEPTIKIELVTKDDKPIFNTKVGDTIIIKLIVENVESIENCHWTLPKDSIFFCKNNFNASSPFVAQFSWQILDEGAINLPIFTIEAKTLDAKSVQKNLILTSNPSTIIVEKLEIKTKNETQSIILNDTEKQSNLNKEIAIELCRIRQKERHALPYSNVQKERVALENNLSLPQQIAEGSYLIYHALFGLALVFFVLSLIIFAIKKSVRASMILSIFVLIFFLLPYIYKSIYLRPHAIFCGTKMYNVPDKFSSSTFGDFGQCCIIENKANGYYYVKINDIYSWVEEKDLLKID